MNTKAIAAAVAVLVAGIPALASAAQANAPISVTGSQLEPSYGIQNQLNPGLVNIRFVNTSAVPAVEVDFTIDQDGMQLGRIQDVGTFAQGVAENHTFWTDAVALDPQLTVAEVKFADGSTWYNDQPTARSQASVSFLSPDQQ